MKNRVFSAARGRRAPRTGAVIGRTHWLIILFAGTILTSTSRGQSTPLPAVSTQKRDVPLRVGVATDSFPYSYRDESGNITGFACDILKAVARVMDVSIVLEPSTAPEMNQRFIAGDFDFLHFYSTNPERTRYADFSTPYLTLQGAIFARKNDKRFRSLDDLRAPGIRLATGRAGADYLARHGFLNEKTPITIASAEDAIRLVSEGKCDAALLARLTTMALVKRTGLRNIESTGRLSDDFTLRLGFAVHHGETQLLARLNEGLAILYQSGEFDKIYRTWLGPIETTGFTREQVVLYIAAILAVALIIAVLGLFRQRQLRKRIVLQTLELADSRHSLADAQRLAQLGSWRRSSDPDQPVYWSEETFRIFERNPLSGPPSVSEIINAFHPDDRPLFTANLPTSKTATADYEFEARIEPKPGIRKIIHIRGHPVVKPDGEITAVFGSVQDVTEWKTTEQALRQSEQLLRALYNNIPFAMGVVEADSEKSSLVSVNQEAVRLFSLPSDGRTGNTLSGLEKNTAWRAFWSELFTQCKTTGSVVKTELKRPDEQREFEITIVPLGSSGAARSRYCFLVEDVTTRKQKDAEISQGRRLRAIGELVGGIAHEFNNLLTPILLKADQLQIDWSHKPGLCNELNLIVEAGKRAAELTRRLLTFGRKTDIAPEVFSIKAAVDSNFELLRYTIDRRIFLEQQLSLDLPSLYLNGGDIHQIILNILLNARDTLVEKLGRAHDTHWEPKIIVQGAVLPGNAVTPLEGAVPAYVSQWIKLSFSDTGLGMAPEVVERIFEPFYTTKQVGQGTGLGLATVWHLMVDMGGRIEVESVPGIGTTFHLFFPVREIPKRLNTPAPTPAEYPSVEASAAESAHILLVEDEDIIAKLVTTILRRQGHVVTHAADGRKAWDLITTTPDTFSAMIMDLNIPGIAGVELLTRARKAAFAKPVIVVSGRITEEERAQLIELGVADFVQKPFSYEIFIRALAGVGIRHKGSITPDVAAAAVQK